MKILIVDDSLIIRNKVERFLGSEHSYEMAIDGVEALEFFNQQLPDFVTMDLTMPNMEGVQCIGEIRKINSSVKILVISALDDKLTALEAIKSGANGFLGKPFTEKELANALTVLFK
ncbi:response regulator transcription factor [Marinicellulosiphila megalodicopiae]|uniref:response regulator transcription factor n=1 Tax=Marinicellulosiphila megalodicopiae TaxID=2724896 RepID=UPI003BB1E614